MKSSKIKRKKPSRIKRSARIEKKKRISKTGMWGDHVGDLDRKVLKKRKESSLTCMKDLNRKALKKKKYSNPTQVRGLDKK